MAALTERIPRCIFRAASGTQTITTRARLSRCNQTFARRCFPAGDAIGQSIKLPELAQVARPPYLLTSPSASNPILIVGMVRDKRDDGLSKPIEPEIFVPYPFLTTMYTQILVKSAHDPCRPGPGRPRCHRQEVVLMQLGLS